MFGVGEDMRSKVRFPGVQDLFCVWLWVQTGWTGGQFVMNKVLEEQAMLALLKSHKRKNEGQEMDYYVYVLCLVETRTVVE